MKRILGACLAFVCVLAASMPASARGSAGVAPLGDDIVIGKSFTLLSRILHGTRRINIYLPDDYGDSARRFRTLYLLDGGAKEDFHHITGLAQISAAYGNGEELIVVGIEGVDRRHDLTSPSNFAADRKSVPTAGGAAEYRKFLVDELKPWVAAHYRTNGKSTIMGESLAGLFVLETLLTEPGSFDDYISVSPSLWWNDEALSRQAGSLLTHFAARGKRLWLAMAAGDDEIRIMHSAQARLLVALGSSRSGGLSWSARTLAGESHASVYHPAAMAALRALYGTPH